MPAECHRVAASAAAGPVVPPDRCCLRLAAWLVEVRRATAVRRAGHFWPHLNGAVSAFSACVSLATVRRRWFPRLAAAPRFSWPWPPNRAG